MGILETGNDFVNTGNEQVFLHARVTELPLGEVLKNQRDYNSTPGIQNVADPDFVLEHQVSDTHKGKKKADSET